MKKVVLITGANGMLAKHLAKRLSGEYSVRYLTRTVTKDDEFSWDLKSHYIDTRGLIGVNYIIHLAGASVMNKRWSEEQKQSILSSRVDSARLILDELKKHKLSIDAFISASAIGYYGTMTSETIFNEASPQGSDFLSYVCGQWENKALSFQSENVAERVSILRCGLVLAKNGGALKEMIKPIRYGFGSGLGTGKQYMPWIHIDDLCDMFKFMIENENINGIFNAVAPEHITNIELVQNIAKILHKKIWLPHIPSFIIKSLFGERAVILLEGSRISSDLIINKGFSFKYDNLEKALFNILSTDK
ncbi:MAG: TIGR01777 family oxidoreductase [Bacteroidales bacterium]